MHRFKTHFMERFDWIRGKDIIFKYSIVSDMMNFQYFIEVVPTEVWGLTGKKTTYQYSVKEHTRPIDHSSGSHGTPGES